MKRGRGVGRSHLFLVPAPAVMDDGAPAELRRLLDELDGTLMLLRRHIRGTPGRHLTVVT